MLQSFHSVCVVDIPCHKRKPVTPVSSPTPRRVLLSQKALATPVMDEEGNECVEDAEEKNEKETEEKEETDEKKEEKETEEKEETDEKEEETEDKKEEETDKEETEEKKEEEDEEKNKEEARDSQRDADMEGDDHAEDDSVITGPPPSLSFSVTGAGPFSVTLFVQVNMSAYVWCTAKEASEAAPSLMEILGFSQHFFESSGNWEITGLTRDTEYKAYCYAENEQGVGMTASIAQLAQAFTTEDGGCGARA